MTRLLARLVLLRTATVPLATGHLSLQVVAVVFAVTVAFAAAVVCMCGARAW